MDLITVGRPTQGWVQEAVQAYCQRIKHYSTINLVEVKPERHRKGMAVEQVMSAESERLQKARPQGAYVVSLSPAEDPITSEAFAERLGNLGLQGQSHLAFLIGGAYGLHPEILKAAQWQLSLSSLTYSHDLALVVLLEQLYRAFTILRGESYHK